MARAKFIQIKGILAMTSEEKPAKQTPGQERLEAERNAFAGISDEELEGRLIRNSYLHRQHYNDGQVFFTQDTYRDLPERLADLNRQWKHYLSDTERTVEGTVTNPSDHTIMQRTEQGPGMELSPEEVKGLKRDNLIAANIELIQASVLNGDRLSFRELTHGVNTELLRFTVTQDVRLSTYCDRMGFQEETPAEEGVRRNEESNHLKIQSRQPKHKGSHAETVSDKPGRASGAAPSSRRGLFE